MGKIAFVFSGQGAQKAGMGKSFYENSAEIRALFDGAEALRDGTLRQCFEGTAEELKETQNTQPCLYLADLAAAVALVSCRKVLRASLWASCPRWRLPEHTAILTDFVWHVSVVRKWQRRRRNIPPPCWLS